MSAVIVFYKLRKIVRAFTRKRILIVLLLFITTLLLNTTLFYYTEHVLGGRSDIDYYTALYWSLITMATIGMETLFQRLAAGTLLQA